MASLWTPETEKEFQQLLRVARAYGWTIVIWQVATFTGFGVMLYLLIKLFAELQGFVGRL